MREFTLASFAAHVLTMDADIKLAERAAIEQACKIIQRTAKRMIGHPQPQWQGLAPSTLARKGANTPLLETGELRDSIEYTVVSAHEAYVGSNNDKAVWHELGTRAIPPRSFLMLAAMGREREIVEMIGKMIHAAMAHGGVNYRDMMHLIHILKEAGHALHDLLP